jgi:hypothetical protein
MLVRSRQVSPVASDSPVMEWLTWNGGNDPQAPTTLDLQEESEKAWSSKRSCGTQRSSGGFVEAFPSGQWLIAQQLKSNIVSA